MGISNSVHPLFMCTVCPLVALSGLGYDVFVYAPQRGGVMSLWDHLNVISLGYGPSSIWFITKVVFGYDSWWCWL